MFCSAASPKAKRQKVKLTIIFVAAMLILNSLPSWPALYRSGDPFPVKEEARLPPIPKIIHSIYKTIKLPLVRAQ
jgi:hypothetical protein